MKSLRVSAFFWAALIAALWITQGVSAELAKVNSVPITEQDVRFALAGFNEAQRRNILEDSQSKLQIVSNLVDQEIVLQIAKKEKLDQSKDYREMVEGFQKQALAQLYLEKKVLPKLTDAEARKFYQKNKQRFRTDQVHAFHILKPTEQEARALLAEAKKVTNYEAFQILAEKHSADKTAKNNRGGLGYFGRDRFEDGFTQAVFLANTKSVIGPIKTIAGFHIVWVEDRKIGNQMEYGEVEVRVLALLRQSLIQEMVLAAKQNADIAINYPELEKLK